MFCCRECKSCFTSLRSARKHLKSCLSGYYDFTASLFVVEDDD